MSEDIKTSKVSSSFRNDSGGAVTRDYPIIGVVKNNIDPTCSGRIQVALNDMGMTDQDSSDNWVTVSYMSPFYGITPGGAGNKDNYGNYVDTQQSYGFWATPPDIGTMVICIFVNGDINFGYYIGCIPQPGSTHMIPAIGASSNVVIGSSTEASSYGGAPRIPVTEMNFNNPSVLNSESFTQQARPLHSYIASTYQRQGTLRDPARGPIGSSSQRESPSRVFGMSTPGRPIYDGGFTDEAVKDQAASASDEQLRVAGRRGGHTFVMDDGDLTGKDQLIRLRTSQGHQIMMNDSEGTLFIIHANGKSWIELGKSGAVDIYAEDSFNVRTKGDINLRADKNINIDAAEKLTIAAKSIQAQSERDTTLRAGGDMRMHVLGKFSLKTAGSMNMTASGSASYASSGTMYINGSKINLNTGSAPAAPSVNPLKVTAQPDTTFDSSVGYACADGLLNTIVSRAPTHCPWSLANKGVHAAPDSSTGSVAPSEPAGVSSINAAARG